MNSAGQVLILVPQDANLPVPGSGQRGSSTWDGLHAIAALPWPVPLPHPRTGKVVGRATGMYRGLVRGAVTLVIRDVNG
jgi:hypothetical protein